VRSAQRGRAAPPDFWGYYSTPEVQMLQVLVAPDLSVHRSDAESSPFGLSLRDGGLDAAWVRVVGELDIATAPRLEQMLRSAELCARRLVLDLRGVAFMDCCGARVIVKASIRARQAGCRLVVVRGRSSVDRVFVLTGTAAAVETIDLNAGEPPVQASCGSPEGITLHERVARADRGVRADGGDLRGDGRALRGVL
jgi:anti-sigma B factor antagonist